MIFIFQTIIFGICISIYFKFQGCKAMLQDESEPLVEVPTFNANVFLL